MWLAVSPASACCAARRAPMTVAPELTSTSDPIMTVPDPERKAPSWSHRNVGSAGRSAAHSLQRRGRVGHGGRHEPAPRRSTRRAFSRRNFGQTSSSRPTAGSSAMVRSSDRPIGK